MGVLCDLEKMVYTLDTSKAARSEARGEGREKGNLIETTSKSPVAQRAGGIGIGLRVRNDRLTTHDWHGTDSSHEAWGLAQLYY